MGQSLERVRLTKEVITAEGTKYYINNNEEGRVSVVGFVGAGYHVKPASTLSNPQSFRETP